MDQQELFSNARRMWKRNAEALDQLQSSVSAAEYEPPCLRQSSNAGAAS